MLYLVSWMIFGLICGLIAKAIHPGDDPVGFLPTVGIGVAGSFLGGIIEWLLGYSTGLINPSGWIFSILGGVIFCWLWRKYRLDQLIQAQKLAAKEGKNEV